VPPPGELRRRASRARLIASSNAVISEYDGARWLGCKRRMGTAPSSSAVKSERDGDDRKALRENGMSRMSRSPSAFVRNVGEPEPWKDVVLAERGSVEDVVRCKCDSVFEALAVLVSPRRNISKNCSPYESRRRIFPLV
jgi:hypothetical protein